MPIQTTQSKDAAIVDVLNQNVEAVEQIQSAAHELEVVHAVLSTQILARPPQATQGDLEAAVDRTQEIEQQLSDTADSLHKSNQLLREIDAKTGPGTGAA